MSAPRVMIMAAGTGGHIFPGLAVASILRQRGVEVSWLGTPTGLENTLVPAADLKLETITIAGLRGRGLAGWLAAPWRIFKAILQARKLIRRHRPDCVLSMGGYVAGPGGLAARLQRIPLVIHEQNAIAGLTNRWLRPLAGRVMTGFPDTLPGGQHVGNPVRAEIASLPEPDARFENREGPLRVLVIGGSLGARAFTHVVPEAIARLPESQRPHIVHQAGRQFEATKKAYEQAGVEGEVVPFIDDMATAWGEADLAICRAGALTVAELAAAGLAAVLVPFPHAVDDHQFTNARYLADGNAAWLVREADFDARWLAEHLDAMARPQLLSMARSARALARTDAAEAVADACLEVAA
ncbi:MULTISPECIES: undecaprenyldiphospho-muramoylpentapeptide beta-N-acetylglucosaminyltransferase [unclassified Wenzhouxiangella]|uniref:undecaprenyldiphospho-muramoylpentapeptide beta-N-acetylglucosaminyltransferase n=1 Tax=unclassified Wenzhouxiangella TaxID=2613841 RepID=UPI000E327CD1|nr:MULTISPECIES: undecaprenyldiphospho-muramoylpentapeptide beta-N-acetylglucosaminyltransferase [unclassified Wenzhouxiangella]RFF28744.1 undecaprenyldiphospho-muramoylpentapeptide beta-N-acetylglucosaminyltransferase [Wenzhouxiangella sp. 15181]RFP67853.1 undecaprenyldiphospho-muramoylpentapeptide beta-N-acetylglucosaminyltransferase [Wenzhouxiangella sp. 15190]